MSGKGKSGALGAGKPRRHPGVKGLSPHLKEMRRREAEGVKGVDGCTEDGRNVKWRRLSLAEQLKSLEVRFPDGANRQKARIAARIEAAKTAPLATPEAKKDRVEEDAKKLSSREKKQEEMKLLRHAGTTLGDVK